jgi:hypothetical protein
MWIMIDIETYVKYDGSAESEQKILEGCDTEESKKKFLKEKKVGYLYPVLNSREFILGGAITDKGERVIFKSHEKMWNWIEKKISDNAMQGKKTYIYGHNVKYDFYGIAKDLIFDMDSRLKIIATTPFIATWECPGVRKDVEVVDNWGYFLDSYSFFKMSLKDLGESIGYKKLVMPYAIKDFDELGNYMMRDVEIVLKAMKILKEKLKDLGFEPRKFLTAGQIAMTTFMSFIRREKIHYNIMRSGEVYKTKNVERCRPAYRGGRNEAFRNGEFRGVTYIDINSLYPYAMANMPFPKLNEELFLEDPEKELSIDEMLNEKFVGVMQCEVKVPKIKLGYLPVRYRENLHFPVSDNMNYRIIRGTWTTMELREAQKLGYEIKRVFWISLYPKAINVFSEYMDKMYKIRKESQGDMKIVIKLIMNNLYGKFGQFRLNKEIIAIPRSQLSEYEAKGWKYKSTFREMHIIERYNDLYVPKYTNLLLSLFTTAWARDFLYKELSKIPREDLIYCDTDSIIFTGNHLGKFKIGKEMGEWKVVKKNEDCVVIGEKIYRVGDSMHISGLSKRLINEDVFKKGKTLKTKREVGFREAMNKPEELLDKIGTFRDEFFEIRGKSKSNIILPGVIDEREDWVSYENFGGHKDGA